MSLKTATFLSSSLKDSLVAGDSALGDGGKLDELKEDPAEGASMGDILIMDAVGDLELEVMEYLLVDVEILLAVETLLVGEVFGVVLLTELLTMLPRTKNCGWMSIGLARAREEAIFLSKLSSASSSEDVLTKGILPDCLAYKVIIIGLI